MFKSYLNFLIDYKFVCERLSSRVKLMRRGHQTTKEKYESRIWTFLSIIVCKIVCERLSSRVKLIELIGEVTRHQMKSSNSVACLRGFQKEGPLEN